MANSNKSNSGNKNSNKSGGNSNKSGSGNNNGSGGSNNKNQSQNKKKKKKIGFRQVAALVFLVVLAAAYFVGLGYENDIDKKLSLMEVETFDAGDVVEVGKLTAHFMDVGQGDACLIELPDNRVMLIDAGENRVEVRSKLDGYISDVNAVREADGRGEIDIFDYVVVTHSDSDHIGSMKYIIDKIPADVFYRPNQQSTYTGFSDPALTGLGKNGFWGTGIEGKNSETYKNVIQTAYGKSNEVIVTNPNDDTQNCIKPSVAASHEDYYEINFYGQSSSSYDDSNNYSPIIIVEYKGRRIALSGDCEKEGEAEFVALAQARAGRYSVFTSSYYVDVIKLGHHGSRTSSSEAYLSILTPQSSYRQNVFLVISSGEGNSYGHPHPEVLERVEQLSFNAENVLRTDQSGDIAIDLVLHEGSAEAACAIGGVVVPRTLYLYNVAGIEVRYRTVGLAVLIIFALILVPLTFLSAKNKNKIIKAAKNSAQNIKK